MGFALPNMSDMYSGTIDRIKDMTYDELAKTMPRHIDSQLKDFSRVVACYTVAPIIIKSAVDNGFLIKPNKLQQRSMSILIGQFEQNTL